MRLSMQLSIQLSILVITLLTIILLLIVSIYYIRNQFEGFTDENPSILYTNSDIFTKSLNDLLFTEGEEPIYKFKTNPIPGLIKENDKCLLATEPKYIPSRNLDTKYNCGWFFNDDDKSDYKDSFGRLGDENNPVDFDGLKKRYPKGEWIWDLNEAQKKEDVKLCKRINICELSDLMPKKCGYCPSLGYAIPVDTSGQNLYQNNLGITCPEIPITNPNKCVRPLDGQIHARLPCDPNPLTGKLSKECLVRIAMSLGFSEKGALVRILNGDNDGYFKNGSLANFKFIKACKILYDELNIQSENAYYGKGICFRADVVTYYYALKQALYQNKSEKAKKAAGFLINDEPFDECYRRPDETGPFDLLCIQRIALENNFRQEGHKFPKTMDDISKFEDKKWVYIQDYYKRRGQYIYSSDNDVKKQAFLDNFGIVI